MAKRKILGHVGDANPVEHWGGVVYDEGYGHGPHLLYFQSYDAEGETMVSVYDFPIDNFDRSDWYEWDAVASSIGWDEISINLDVDMGLKDYALSLDCEEDPLTCAWLYESLGSYYGFGELDHEPTEMTLEDAEDFYEDFVG